MLIISHRRNTLAQLRATPKSYGVEIDLRSHQGHVVLHHDAWAPKQEQQDFDTWLDAYAHAYIILNIKEEGIEGRVLSALHAKGITQYFLLDQSFPFLVRTMLSGEPRTAVRISEYEPVDMALGLAGRVDWAWLDAFHGPHLCAADMQRLAKAGLKLCVVSPELQGRTSAFTEVRLLQHTFEDAGVWPDAVCTKQPELWNAWAL